MIRKNPYVEENYTIISKMTSMNVASQKMYDENFSQRHGIEIEDSDSSMIAMIDEGKSQTEMKYMSQDLNSKRILESQTSIYGKHRLRVRLSDFLRRNQEVTKKRLSQSANSMMKSTTAFNFSQEMSSQKKQNLCNGCLMDLNNEMTSSSISCSYCKKSLCEKCIIVCGSCQEIVCRICTQMKYEKFLDEIVCPNCFSNK